MCGLGRIHSGVPNDRIDSDNEEFKMVTNVLNNEWSLGHVHNILRMVSCL